MADIEMCSQVLCPNAASCYRVQAPPNPHWQSYLAFPYKISAGEVDCCGYWPMFESVAMNSTAVGDTNGK
jgi:hypothetical protein